MDFSKLPRSLVERIQKALKLQESEKAGGNIEAAGRYAEIISNMLAKYNVDINDVKSVEFEEKQAVITKNTFDVMEFEKSHEGGWVLRLTQVVARVNMCRVISLRNSTEVWVVGTEANAQIVWFIVEQLVNRLRPIAAKEWAEYDGYEKRNTWKRGFFTGAVTGIGEQLMRKQREEEQKAQAAEAHIHPDHRTEDQKYAVTVTSLMKSENNRVAEFIQQNMRVRSVSSGKGTSSTGGRATGYATGSTMNIHGGLSGGVPKNRRIG